MEKQPALPAQKPPLGGAFYFALLLPLVLLGITAALVDKGDIFIPVLGLAGLATLICSAFLAARLARRFSKTGEASLGLTILMFLALQTFYAACFFLGYKVLALTA